MHPKETALNLVGSAYAVPAADLSCEEVGAGDTAKFDSPLLGIFEDRAIYLLSNGILKDRSIAGGNVLTGPVYDILPRHDGPKVVYAAATRLGPPRSTREGIVFKQTPYALEL
jgi:hypothetical protein